MQAIGIRLLARGALDVGLADRAPFLAGQGDGIEQHLLGHVVVGQLLVGRGTLAPGAALEAEVFQARGTLCRLARQSPPGIAARAFGQPPQFLPDPPLAQGGDAGEPVADLEKVIAPPAVLAHGFGAVVDLQDRLDVACSQA
jgi:hypothetical protein